MKKTLLLLALGLSGFLAAAQAPSIAWQKSLGGTGSDQATAIQQTSDGGYMVAGYSSSTNGDITGNRGSNDFWIAKLNATGSITWQKSLGGSGADQANAIQQTSDGGYIIAGQSNSVDGDVTGVHVSGTAADYWVVRTDATGNILWQKSLGGTKIEFARSIQQTADGHFIVAGSAQSSDGDVPSTRPGGTSTNHDFWILKLNGTTGAIIWQKALGGTGADQATCIQQTTDGGYIVAGSTDSNDGNVTGYHGGSSSDYWVVKLDASGNITWQKALGGTANDQASFVQQTSDGGYIVTGLSSSNDGDVSGNNGSADAWVVKLNASGSIAWQKSIGGSSSDQARVIRQTSDGGYILTGYTSSNNTGDLAGLPSYGGFGDYWVVRLNASGNILWQKVLGGTGYDDAWDVRQTADGNYIVAGASNSTNNDVIGNHGNYDYWIVKLEGGCTPVNASVSVTACSTYTWTAGNGQTYTANTTAIHTIANGAANGCDSVITLTLTVNQPTSATQNITHCGPYTLNGQTYTTSGTYTQTLTNAHNCDSVITLNLTVNQPTSATQNVTHCGPYTLNGQTYTTSGTYTQTLANAHNCDSVITLNLVVNQPSAAALSASICDGQVYTFGTQQLRTPGVYTHTVAAANGCDSTITLTLAVTTINNSVTQSQNTLTAAATSGTFQWINCDDNSPIPNATNSSYTVTQNGRYAVIVTENGCSAQSSCFTITNVHVNEYGKGNLVRIFPNPSNGDFMLESNFSGTISVTDLSGKTVHAQRVDKGVQAVKMPAVSKGFYYLRTNTGLVYKLMIH